jgi:hypothetical protein
MNIADSVVNWLLEDENPSVKARTLTELLDVPPDDPRLAQARAGIPASKPVRKIFDKMHPEGYWLFRGEGEGVAYAHASTTHFVLAYLAELGINRSDERVARAVERYLSLKARPGVDVNLWQIPPDYRNLQSCLYAYNLRTFIRLGYREDARTQERVAVLLDDRRFDGGYLCRRPSFKTRTKSCIRGTIKALTAFAELPELWQTSRCQELVDYFLRRRVFYRTDTPDQVMRSELTCTTFPFVINGSLLEPLVALSYMGYGQHPALEPAWEVLETKKDAQGRYIADKILATYFEAGIKGQPNKWVTLYAYLAIKYRGG